MITTVFKRTTLAIGLALLAPLGAWAQVSVSVTIAPPPLPLYAQPPIPGEGYLWTPGYWALGSGGAATTIWVPGTWVDAAQRRACCGRRATGRFSERRLLLARRLLGLSSVGYYGGLNYGYGYNGSGYWGGRWDRGHFRYNTAVNNLPSRPRARRLQRAAGARAPERTRESFNGGDSHYRTPAERPASAASKGAAHGNADARAAWITNTARFGMPEQRMANNHGAPPTAATPRPGGFGDPAGGTRADGARDASAAASAARPGPARVENNGGGHPQVQSGHGSTRWQSGEAAESGRQPARRSSGRRTASQSGR